MTSTSRLRAYEGPAVLSYGFRPFFLLASLYSGLAMLAWLPIFGGELALPTAFAGRDWHVHEMLYGFVGAVVAGFLLTAVPNWTGRLPLRGPPLLVLVLAWVAGRLAVGLSGLIGWCPAALVDLSFLALLTGAVAREILAGRNWRNLKVLMALIVLLVGNALFHVEAHVSGLATFGTRIGLAAALGLVMLIGGRIVPSFTRNWLVRENPGRLPVSAGRFDAAAVGVSVAALAAWVVVPEGAWTGTGLVTAGLVQAVRLARWAGDRTWRDRLVLILHVAYGFVPLGFVLVGFGALGWFAPGAGLHAWTGGSIGVMTLAVMSRASLGHTGRSLAASPAVQAVYALATASVLARICASAHPAWFGILMPVAGALWATAFLGFATASWAVLTRPSVT